MKDRFVKILVFLLLITIAAESASFLWMHTEVTAVLTEKEEKGDSPKTEIEKEEAKDKIAQWQNLRVEADADGLLHVFGNINIRYAPYLSLPELPPEQA